jgi:5,5'-dehydrodivanillate O-demethylase
MSNSFALQFEDLEPVGPGTPAGRYLRLFWHPVYRAGDLPNSRAKPIEILGEKFTLYRDDAGLPHLVAFRCAHRGSQLSLGWIEGDALRCRYHGWKFDAAGQCIEQPNEPQPFCQRVTIPTYPVKEYAGLIFAYLGAGEPPPFRYFVDLDQPGTIVVDPVEILPCSFWNKMDNDPAHVPWVHRASQQRLGRPEPYTVQEVNHQEAPYGLLGTNRNGGGDKRFIMPNIRQWWPRSRTRGFEGRYLGETKVVFTVPINDAAFCSFDVTHTPFQGDAAKAYIEVHTPRQEAEAETRWDLAKKVLAGELTLDELPADISAYTSFSIEDYCTQVGQGPIAGRGREQLGRTDTKIALIRRLWLKEVSALLEGRPLTQWDIPTEPYAAAPPESATVE